MFKKCSDFISSITKDISNRCPENTTPIKSEWESAQPNKSCDFSEDKENLNVTNFFKLNNTLEIKDCNGIDKAQDSIFTKTAVWCDQNNEFNLLDKTVEDIYCEKMEICEDSIIVDEEVWNSPSDLKNFAEILSYPSQNTSNLNSNAKPRESLLTSFDPLYQNEIENYIDVSLLCKDIINAVVEEALLIVDLDNLNDTTISLADQTVVNMADISDKVRFEDKDISILEYPSDISDKEKVNLLEEQISDIKLQLNASQQIRINLELQLRQKEEVLIKIQAEFSRKEQSFQKEIKQLQEKLDNKSVENVDSQLKELQDMVKDLKSQEAKLHSELSHRRADELEYQKVMEEYEKKITDKVGQLQKFQEEHETVKCHLANLELAFSDLHQKYERTKKIIEGYKSNEDLLKEAISSAQDSVRKSEEKYETLKAHAKAQIEKSNLEIQGVREHYDFEITKLNAIVRRLEIKVNSLTDSLDQKTKECIALSALCDEVTGQSVIS